VQVLSVQVLSVQALRSQIASGGFRRGLDAGERKLRAHSWRNMRAQ
jgi:hypothetical protein